jgi:predicted RNase H-like HicB family nuclease
MVLMFLKSGDIVKKTFTVVVERDPESGWLVGEVVELSGCYTQAPDLPALETNVKEAIAAYLSDADPDEDKTLAVIMS